MRLVTIRQGGREVAAVVLPDGVASVEEVYGLSGEGADLLSLLESGRFYELKEAYDRVRYVEERPLNSPTPRSTAGRARSGVSA